MLSRTPSRGFLASSFRLSPPLACVVVQGACARPCGAVFVKGERQETLYAALNRPTQRPQNIPSTRRRESQGGRRVGTRTLWMPHRGPHTHYPSSPLVSSAASPLGETHFPPTSTSRGARLQQLLAGPRREKDSVSGPQGRGNERGHPIGRARKTRERSWA